MGLWDFIKWLSNADIGVGLNIASIFAFCIMLAYSIRVAMKSESRSDTFRLRAGKAGTSKSCSAVSQAAHWERYLFMLCRAIFPLLLFYSTLDCIGGIIYALTRQDCLGALAFEFSSHINPILLPWSYTVMPFYYLAVHKFTPYFKWRNLIYMIAIQTAFIFCTILIFQTHNMRMLTGDARALFYISSFIPMWLMWSLGFYFTCRPLECLPPKSSGRPEVGTS
jgi:hypothetical protein